MHVCFLIHPLESLDKLDFHCSSLSLVDESLSERLEVAEALSSDVSTLSLVLYVVSAADVCLPFLPLPALLFAPLPFFPDLVEDCRMKQEMMNYESRHAWYRIIYQSIMPDNVYLFRAGRDEMPSQEPSVLQH